MSPELVESTVGEVLLESSPLVHTVSLQYRSTLQQPTSLSHVFIGANVVIIASSSASLQGVRTVT